MKNQHLIPINIVDLIEKVLDPKTNENERNNYIQRLEAIRDICDNTVKMQLDKESRSKLSYSRIGRNNI